MPTPANLMSDSGGVNIEPVTIRFVVVGEEYVNRCRQITRQIFFFGRLEVLTAESFRNSFHRGKEFFRICAAIFFH